MCPSFLPLYDAKENGNKTDKWLQLFISHNKGCQYYIGTLDGEKLEDIEKRYEISIDGSLKMMIPKKNIDKLFIKK